VGAGKRFASVADAFVTIARTEGLPSLYRGLAPSFLSILPEAAITYGFSDLLKMAYLRATGEERAAPGPALAFGVASAFTGQLVAYPLEVVARRAQASPINQSVAAALRSIVKTQGVGGLYNGIVPATAEAYSHGYCQLRGLRGCQDSAHPCGLPGGSSEAARAVGAASCLSAHLRQRPLCFVAVGPPRVRAQLCTVFCVIWPGRVLICESEAAKQSPSPFYNGYGPFPSSLSFRKLRTCTMVLRWSFIESRTHESILRILLNHMVQHCGYSTTCRKLYFTILNQHRGASVCHVLYSICTVLYCLHRETWYCTVLYTSHHALVSPGPACPGPWCTQCRRGAGQ